MRVVIVGTGNIATLYGWALADAGHEVIHLVRPGGTTTRPPVARLDILDERPDKPVVRCVDYAWSLAEETPAAADVVLVATPAGQASAALADLAPRLPEATFAAWALQWDPIPGLEGSPAQHRIVLGYPDSGGTRNEAGRYVLSLGAEPNVGPFAGGGSAARDRVEQVRELLASADLRPAMHDPFEPWLWVHCALTVPYWVALAQDRSMSGFLGDGRRLRRAFRASHEMLRLCEARGVDLTRHPEVDTVRLPALLFPFAFRMLMRTNESMRRVTAHAVAGIEEGIVLCREALRTAAELDVAVPELRRLAEDAGIAEPARVAPSTLSA